MLPNTKTATNLHVFLAKEPKGKLIPKAPPKYTVEDWNFSNNVKLQAVLGQQRLMERLRDESRRVIDQVTETTKAWQRDVEYNMKERIAEIEFLCDELNKQKKTAMREIEALTTYRNRVQRALDFISEKALPICQQCLVWRESRIGVDLCDDEVDRELSRELKSIKGCDALLSRTLKETDEQIRKLRAASVQLDEDLEFKYKSLLIDQKNMNLKDTQQNLGDRVDLTQNICIYTLAEWQNQTYMNLQNNAKDLDSAAQMRAYIDLLLLQVCEDLSNQTERTNLAFEKSIRQIKQMKSCLEDKHNEIMASAMDTEQLIKLLQQQVADKERAMLLCRTRLSNRSQRPGLELACDTVHDALNFELSALQTTLCQLKQKIAENKALLRYLLHIQLMQEEEINIKANTIKIDEVDCMTLRSGLVFTNF